MTRLGQALRGAPLTLMAGTALAIGMVSPVAGAKDAPRGLAHPARWPVAHSRGLIDPVT